MVIENDKVKLSAFSSTSKSAAPVPATDCIPTPAGGFNYNPHFLTEYLQKVSGPVEITLDKQGLLLFDANQRKFAVGPRGPAVLRKKEKPAEAKADKSKKVKTKKTAEKKEAA